jgi:hypothetical protein
MVVRPLLERVWNALLVRVVCNLRADQLHFLSCPRDLRKREGFRWHMSIHRLLALLKYLLPKDFSHLSLDTGRAKI